MKAVDLGTNYAFGWISSLGEGFTRLLGPGFAIAGVALTLYLIIGAFRFLLSGGDKSAIEGGRNMITHAIIGFVLLMLVFLIMQFIPEFIGIDFKILK